MLLVSLWHGGESIGINIMSSVKGRGVALSGVILFLFRPTRIRIVITVNDVIGDNEVIVILFFEFTITIATLIK